MGPIITLTTDFGLKDPYQGSMKGAILTVNPGAAIVDITHLVTPGNIVEGAFILNEAFRYFPDGTVHVCVVDPGVGGARRPLLLEMEGHLFVGPDNGVFGLVAAGRRVKKAIHLLENRYFREAVSPTFHGRDIFGPVAAHLSLGKNPILFGEEINDVCRLAFPEPEKKDGQIVGEVVYIDSFGNLITNISGTGLAGPGIEVSIKGLIINGLTKTYGFAEKGTPIALVGSSGYLEIAFNMSSAAKALGADTGERVTVRKV